MLRSPSVRLLAQGKYFLGYTTQARWVLAGRTRYSVSVVRQLHAITDALSEIDIGVCHLFLNEFLLGGNLVSSQPRFRRWRNSLDKLETL